MIVRRHQDPPSRPVRTPLVTTIVVAPEPLGAGWDVHCPCVADCREFDTIEEARAHADTIAARHGLLVEERS